MRFFIRRAAARTVQRRSDAHAFPPVRTSAGQGLKGCGNESSWWHCLPHRAAEQQLSSALLACRWGLGRVLQAEAPPPRDRQHPIENGSPSHPFAAIYVEFAGGRSAVCCRTETTAPRISLAKYVRTCPCPLPCPARAVPCRAQLAHPLTRPKVSQHSALQRVRLVSTGALTPRNVPWNSASIVVAGVSA